MAAVHGPENVQSFALRELAKSVQNRKDGALRGHAVDIAQAATGALANLKAELAAGLVGSLQRKFEGGVLADFIQLARLVLQDEGDNPKNVAAVLAAAAYEDTIRRMAEATGQSTTGVDLQEVTTLLKDRGILYAPQLGIAVGYLGFRNHALHARWAQIDRSSVNLIAYWLLWKNFCLSIFSNSLRECSTQRPARTISRGFYKRSSLVYRWRMSGESGTRRHWDRNS
jgi:hypothetical protein